MFACVCVFLLGNDAATSRLEIMRRHSRRGKIRAHTKTHTNLRLRFYSTETGKTIHASPPPALDKYAQIPQARFGCQERRDRNLPQSPKTLRFQPDYRGDRPCGFNVATGRVVRAKGGKSINLSIILQKCTCDFNAHLQKRHVYSPRTHALTHSDNSLH